MHPSGEQVEIRHRAQRAVVVEVGGGLRCYDVDGRAVLDGYGVDELVTGARGQPLIPWPNRRHGGTYTWDGEQHVVPLDEPEQGNALHWLCRWRNWRTTDATNDAVTMRLWLHPLPAYPFALDLAVEYRLDDDGLTVATTATNIGPVDALYAHGAHPYVKVGPPRINTALLRLPAVTWLPTDESQIATGRERGTARCTTSGHRARWGTSRSTTRSPTSTGLPGRAPHSALLHDEQRTRVDVAGTCRCPEHGRRAARPP